MNTYNPIGRVLLTTCLCLTVSGAYAQTPQAPPAPPQNPYEPSWTGRQGRRYGSQPQTRWSREDVDLAHVTAKDYLMDLGSGDGRTVIAAAKRGARALGIEYNPDMVELSKRNAAAAGVADKASFVKADIFESDFSKATVITMFLLPSLNLQLRPKLLDLAPGTRLVSNSFTMAVAGRRHRDIASQDCTSWCTAHFWNRACES